VGELGECVHEAGAVFGGGGQVGANEAELLGSGQGAQAAGDIAARRSRRMITKVRKRRAVSMRNRSRVHPPPR
jgi:hypothetical protein